VSQPNAKSRFVISNNMDVFFMSMSFWREGSRKFVLSTRPNLVSGNGGKYLFFSFHWHRRRQGTSSTLQCLERRMRNL